MVVNKKAYDFQSMMRASSKIFMIQIMSIPVLYLPGIFISINSSRLELSYFSTGNKISMIFNLVLTSVTQLLLPYLAKLYCSDNWRFKNEASIFMNIMIMTCLISTIIIGSLSR